MLAQSTRFLNDVSHFEVVFFGLFSYGRECHCLTGPSHRLLDGASRVNLIWVRGFGLSHLLWIHHYLFLGLSGPARKQYDDQDEQQNDYRHDPYEMVESGGFGEGSTEEVGGE